MYVCILWLWADTICVGEGRDKDQEKLVTTVSRAHMLSEEVLIALQELPLYLHEEYFTISIEHIHL